MEIERKWMVKGWPEGLPQGGICHAAGLYQCAAHCAHPGRSPHRRQNGLHPLLQIRGGLAREEIERSIDKELFDDLEYKIIAKPLIPKLRRSYTLPDGSVLEVNHVDEGQPTEFWYAEVEYPRWKQPLHGSRKAAALAITSRMK